MKIVINACHGGFGLSDEALRIYKAAKEIRGVPATFHDEDDFGEDSEYHIPRNDPVLVAVVEKLGERANGKHADLKIVEIPDDVQWEIEEYDGSEWVAEKHRTWR